jgi:hypothetical protein
MDVITAFVSADVPLTPENVKPGWLALGVVALLCLATFFLARSFIKHARRASEPWPGEDRDDSTP